MEFVPVDLSRHLDLCIAFRQDAYEVSFGHQNGFDTQEITLWFKSIVEDPEAGFFHVIKDDQIIGQLECRYPVADEEGHRFGYINLFYLLPEFRHQGLGKQLQDFLFKRFVEEGCVYARLRYIPGNDAGERFYLKHGWYPVGEPGVRGPINAVRFNRKTMIVIRDFREQDAPILWALFYNTVRNVNRRDYNEQQLKAWAPDEFDSEIWLQKMMDIQPFVAELDGVIVGYSDVQSSGLVDHFFCHHAYQGQGVGRALMAHVFKQAKEKGLTRLYSEVSITARPFFEHMGFSVLKEQQVEVRGAILTNYVMERAYDGSAV